MPFIHVYGIPPTYLSNSDFLERLENELVVGLSQAMEVKEHTCIVDFAVRANRKMRPTSIIWAYVTSGAFTGNTKEVAAKKASATATVAAILKKALQNKYSVEVFPVALDGDHKAYLKA